MTIEKNGKLAPGLYFVATPIGNARDITLRTLDILGSADVLASEDTRSLRRLMEIHGIAPGNRPLISYHEHNSEKARPKLLSAIAAGQSVVYASEAGTPLISDPGFDLLRAAQNKEIAVTSAPGASAVVTALTLAGLPTDRFLFAGFLPSAKAARKKALADLSDIKATLVFYESPKRLPAMLRDAAEMLGGARDAAICRELTKRFEETRRGSLDALADAYTGQSVKGEVVVLIGRGSSPKISEMDIEERVKRALDTMSVRDAAESVSRELGVKRRPIYQLAMRLAQEKGG